MRMPRTTVSMPNQDARSAAEKKGSGIAAPVFQLEILDHRCQGGIDGAGKPERLAEPSYGAVHVIDLGVAALHQVLPHRGNRSCARERAIDQGDEVLLEADPVGARDRETLVDDLLFQTVRLRIDDAAHFATEQRRGWVDHAVEDGFPPHLFLDVRNIATVKTGGHEHRRYSRRLLVLLDQRVAGHGAVDHAGPHQHATDLGDGAQHERAVLDQVLYEVFRVQAVLHAQDGDALSPGPPRRGLCVVGWW